MQDLRTLADLMSRGDARKFTGESRGFSQPHEVPSGYVWPNIAREVPSDSHIVLISAAGAMGKSIAAQAIAARSRSILLDTAKVRVGSNTLSGGLAKALGVESYANFVEDFQQSRASLVIDGLDEALLFSGSEHFEAFLDDLCWFLGKNQTSPAVVVLGRDDAIDTVELHLLERGVRFSRTELAPLPYLTACNLIDNYLDAKVVEGKPFTVHRENRVPFESLRDEVLIDLGSALDHGFRSFESWDLVEHFLGYPAVLLAVSERLAVSNPQAELSSLRSARRDRSLEVERGALLLEVIRSIVGREQAKLALHVGNFLGMSPDDPIRRSLYNESEQVRRLLAHRGLAPDTNYGPEALSAHERANYDAQVRSFVSDHPFSRGQGFSSVVFADYVKAYAASSPLAGVQHPQLNPLTLEVGPFFAHFLSALQEDEASVSGSPPSMPLSYVDAITRSVRLAHPKCAWRLTAFSSSQCRLDVLLDLDPTREPLGFLLEGGEDVLVLRSPLSHAEILTDLPLLIEGTANEIRLGPGVYIQAATVSLNAEEIRIAPRRSRGAENTDSKSGFGVFIGSGDDIESPPRARVFVVEDDCLRTYAKVKRHPWVDYHFELTMPSALVEVETWLRVAAFTRRILTSLHPLANGRIGTSTHLLHRYSGSSELGDAAIRALLTLGVLRENAEYTILDLGPLVERGVSYAALSGDDPHTHLEQLIAAMFATASLKKYTK